MNVTRRTSGQRRREEPRPTTLLLGGLLTVAIVALIAFVALRTPGGAPGVGYRTIYASVPDIGNLRKHQEVRIAGVRVGQVLDSQAHRDRVRLKLQLNPGTSELPADTTLRVRAAGLLGARYVELRPGDSPEMLRDGGEIQGGEDTLSAGVSDAIETFDAETRGAFGAAIDELGTGLLGRGRGVNDMLKVGAVAAQEFQDAVGAVLARPGAARRLMPSLAAGASAVDAAREDFARAMRPSADVVDALADRRGAIARTLSVAPPALVAARPALDEGRGLLAATTALARAARRTLPPAPPGLREASRLLRDSHEPLRKAATLLRRARPAVPAALRVTNALDPVLTPLHELLADLHPAIRQLGRHGCDLRNLSENWRSVLGFGTAGGTEFGPYNTFRIQAVAGPDAASQLGQGAFTTPDALIDRNLYPAPCEEDGGEYQVVNLLPLDQRP